MTEHWFMTSGDQQRTLTGEKITIITDVPCHLWMRWTLVDPRIHKITRLRRGLASMDDWYYCFDVYEDNEQAEPGDTLIHTFIKEPWPYCEQRWFYFHGNINGVPSPSTSAIFTKHPVAPKYTMYYDIQFPSHEYDGYFATWRGSPYLTYPENWAADHNGFSLIEQQMSLYNHIYNRTASIYRGVFFFDTTDLPADAVIFKAQIVCSVFDLHGARSPSLAITPATLVHEPPIADDYSNLRQTPGVLGLYPFDDMEDPSRITIDLTSDAFPHVNPQALTKLGARINFEIDANPSDVDYEGIRIRNYENTVVLFRPLLILTYGIPT